MSEPKPQAYLMRTMAAYKIDTLTSLIKEMRKCHELNLPFVASMDDSGFTLQIEQSREYMAFILPAEPEIVDAGMVDETAVCQEAS